MIKAIKRLAENELFYIFFGAILFFAAIILGAVDFPTASLVLYICALAVSGCHVFLDGIEVFLKYSSVTEHFPYLIGHNYSCICPGAGAVCMSVVRCCEHSWDDIAEVTVEAHL